AFDALRFCGVEKQLPAALGVASASESRLGKLFVFNGRALAAEMEVELRTALYRRYADNNAIRSFFQRDLESLGVGHERTGLVAPVNAAPVYADRHSRAGGTQELHGGPLRDLEVAVRQTYAPRGCLGRLKAQARLGSCPEQRLPAGLWRFRLAGPLRKAQR